MRYAEVVETFLDQAAPHLPQQSQWDLRPEDRRDLRAKFWGIAVPVVPTEAGALLNLALEDIKLARAGYPRELELPDRNPFTPAQAVRGIMANRLVEIGMHGGNQTRRISAPYGPSLALHELEECVEHDLREWASTKSPRVVAQDGDSELEEIVLAWLPAEDAIGTYLRLAEGELTLFSGLIWLQNDEAGYSYVLPSRRGRRRRRRRRRRG